MSYSNTYSLYAGEVRTLTWDFTNDPTLGTDAITAATISIPAMATNLAAGLTGAGAGTINSKKVTRTLTVATGGAVIGQTYVATCTATTNAGQTLVQNVSVLVLGGTA